MTVKPMQCIVEPGEAIFIPTNWRHATCNLSPLTLSFGGQGDLGVFPDRELIDAILDDDQAAATRLLQSPATSVQRMLRARSKQGLSAVHVAVMHNRLWALPALSAAGADFSEEVLCTERDYCALWAVSASFPSGVQGAGALYLATMYGTLGALQYLVTEEGLSLSDPFRVGRLVQGQWRWSRMNIAHVSCAYNAESILAWALEQEPSLAAMEDVLGRLPLHWCAFEALPDLVRLLLDAARTQGSAALRSQLSHRNRRGETAQDLVSVSHLEEFGWFDEAIVAGGQVADLPRWAADAAGAEVYVARTRQVLQEARGVVGGDERPQRPAAEAPAAEAPATDQATLSVMQLHARCQVAGVAVAELDDAMDSDQPRAKLIDLLRVATQQQQQQQQPGQRPQDCDPV